MWDFIIHDYDAVHACRVRDEIAWFRRRASLRSAIETAAQAIDARGRRYSHQRRIQRASIANATAALVSAAAAIREAKSFDELLNVVTVELRGVRGAGPLYRYDTSMRVGAYLQLLPTRVYMHAGTREGARFLGLPYWRDTLEMHEVPTALRTREPHEVEDILCIYKNVFAGEADLVSGCSTKRRRRRKC